MAKAGGERSGKEHSPTLPTVADLGLTRKGIHEARADPDLIYARENSTQRGNSGTAQAGTVASAIRFIAKAIFTGNMSGFPDMSKRAIESAQGSLASDKGMVDPIVTEFLEGVPGINENSVRQQLAKLKTPGN